MIFTEGENMVISINDASEIPIYQQIRNQIVLGISDGRLAPGEQLPTVRALAEEIGINSMTVSKAYTLLKQEGYIYTDRRSGARVRQEFETNKELSEKSQELLRQIISEAKVSGMTQTEFFDLCKRIFIMLFLFSTQNKYENGRLFAVNMKKEWIKDATVADIRQKFKKEMRYYAILLAIVPFVSLLTSHMSIQLTIWMFWLLAAIFLLSLPIMRANHRLKTWKTQNHLYEDRQPEHYVELKQAGSVRKVRFLPFFLPNIISIASALLLLPKSSGLGISCLIGASCGLVFWLVAVWIDRQPVSVISTDSDVNINYARAKKNLWKNFWLISCWLNTALILFLEILTLSSRHMGICSIAGMIVYTLLLLLLCIFCMIKLKKIDRSYAQKRNLTSDENDDRNWIGGILYYNPSDPHTMVEQRVGIGTTVNMATSLGKGLTIFSAIMMLSFPLLCIWLIQEEFTPIDLVIQNHTLCAQHLKTDYQIPLSEIKDPTLLTASDLPDWTRTNGTSMDTLEKGTFTISRGEDVNVFLNPENDAFIQFSANGKTYYMGGVDDTQTKGIYEELLTH